MSARPRHRYTYAEYLAYERDCGRKHEYDDGAILAIPGGSRRHNALAPIQGDPADPLDATITNPTLLVEVLSPSTRSCARARSPS